MTTYNYNDDNTILYNIYNQTQKNIIFHSICASGSLAQNIVIPHEFVAITFFMNLLKNDNVQTRNLCNSFIKFIRMRKGENNISIKHISFDYLNALWTEFAMYCCEFEALTKGFAFTNGHSYNDILKFGEIVTEFLIRVLGVSFVGVSGQKNVLTSNSHLQNEIIEQLDDQYKIFKMKKAIFVPSDNNDEIGYYEYITPLPYAPDFCECYVETKLNHFERVLSKK